MELFETVDELAAALQLADQYCYSNTFIYTQPGNGKVDCVHADAHASHASATRACAHRASNALTCIYGVVHLASGEDQGAKAAIHLEKILKFDWY